MENGGPLRGLRSAHLAILSIMLAKDLSLNKTELIAPLAAQRHFRHGTIESR